MIRVEKLQKAYPAKKGSPPVQAVDNISFNVSQGELMGLLGSNGAGKTTTIKMLCGLIKPDFGSIYIDGLDLLKQRTPALSNISAVLEGNRNIYWRLTAKENLEFFAGLRGLEPRGMEAEIDYFLELFGLTEKINVEARKLSRGMQQKLAIAVALISKSKVVLLDEPTLGLDVQASYEIRQLLKKIVQEQERTIILTTHDMNVVQDTCERVIIINDGRIVADDRIENLLKLFKVKIYKIIVQGSLTSAQKSRLVEIDAVQEMEQFPNETAINVLLEKSETLYDVIDILRADSSLIKSIDQEQNNFERVFLEIVERG